MIGFGVAGYTPQMPANVIQVVGDKYLWTRRCLQGAFHSQQLFDYLFVHCTAVLELDRTEA